MLQDLLLEVLQEMVHELHVKAMLQEMLHELLQKSLQETLQEMLHEVSSAGHRGSEISPVVAGPITPHPPGRAAKSLKSHGCLILFVYVPIPCLHRSFNPNGKDHGSGPHSRAILNDKSRWI